MEKVFVEHSPLFQVEKMPDIPYLIIHGDEDKLVNKEMHSDRLVNKMIEKNLNVEYLEVKGMGHGTLKPIYVFQRIIGFVNCIIK